MSTSKVPGAALEYVRKYRDVKYYETIFELLAKQYEAAKIDEAREAAVIQVVDEASVPDRKSSPKRLLLLLLATVIAILVSAAFATVMEIFERSLEDPEQATRLAKLRRHLGFESDGLVIRPKR